MNFRTFYPDFVMPWRFREARRGNTREGGYSYWNTGPNTARLRFRYDDDDVERCTHGLTFTKAITGTATFTYGEGASQEYEWRLVEIPSR